MLEQLAVGSPYHRVVGRGEGIFFDIKYPHIELIYNMQSPTAKELAAVKAENPFEIRVAEVNDVIFIMTKFGSLNWMDAPYNPNLGDCRLDDIESAALGYGLYFLLTDSPSGVIKHMRLLGLGNSFSAQFRELVYANKAKGIEVFDHDKKYKAVFAGYTTRELAERSTLRYRIRPD